MTLEEARAWIMEARAQREGEICPCCDQLAKIYPRTINAPQAAALIILYRECGREYGHLPTLRLHLAPHHSNEEPKLRFWGLIEEQFRESGKPRKGWWRLTDRGELFVRGVVRVPEKAFVYNDEFLGYGDGPTVAIFDVLNERFNYDKLRYGDLS